MSFFFHKPGEVKILVGMRLLVSGLGSRMRNSTVVHVRMRLNKVLG